MKNTVLFLLILCFISCNNVEKEFYENGNLFKKYSLNGKNEFEGLYEEYFENGNLKEKHFYKNGIKIDSSIYFYENNKIIKKVDLYLSKDTIIQKNFYKNGNIESVGKLYKNSKIGNWIYNREDGSLEKEFEFMTIKGEQYTNQGRYFDVKSNLLNDLGNFYDLSLSSTNIKLKDTVFLNLKYKPLLALNSNSYLCLSSKIDKDFGNIDQVQLDTIYFEKNLISNYRLLFRTRGVKNIRGFINEYYDKKPDLNDSIIRGDRRLYLGFTINVN